MIEVIPPKIENALILFHSAGQNSRQYDPFIPYLQAALPYTYILAEDGPISGSPVVQNGTYYGEDTDRYWFMFPMKDACSEESFKKNRIAQGASLISASAYLNREIDKIAQKYNLGISNIVLCGFQHGSCLALSTAMMRRNSIFDKVILIQPFIMEAFYLAEENKVDATKIVCIENEYMRKKTFDFIGIYTEKEFVKLGLNAELVLKKEGKEEITIEIVDEIINQVNTL